MSLLSEILGLGGGAALTTAAYNRMGDVGEDARSFALGSNYGPDSPLAQQGLAQYTSNMANFRPFGVTSSLGNAQVDQSGGVTTNLSAQQQAMQDQLGANASSMFGQVMQGTGEREADVYERLRAVQRPEEERQRLGLENRLMGQGRLGVQTANYGGTPEQLAMAKAQAEAQNSAGLMALQQGQAEQMQQANIGNSFMQNQYMPQANLLNLLQSGTQNAQLADLGRRQAAGAYGEAAMSGFETDLAARLGQGNLMGNLGTGLLSGSLQQGGLPNLSDLFGL